MKDPAEYRARAWPMIFGVEWNYKRLALGYLVLAALVPLLMIFADQQLSQMLKAALSKEMIRIWAIITWFGEAGLYIVSFLIAFLFFRLCPGHWLMKLRHRHKELQQASLLAFTCFIISGILALTGKFLVGRQRPYESEDLEALTFVPFNFDHVFQSFPSGHSQVIFTLAAVFSLFYPRQNILYLAIGLLIAFSRLTVFNHFLSDILVGGFVGITGVVLTYRLFFNKQALPEQVVTKEEPEYARA